jgi:anti-anti-sigma factor
MPEESRDREAEVVTIHATSYLSGKSGEELEREFDRNLQEGRRDFVIDFRETEIINSIGISIVIGIIERAMDRQGSIRIANLSKVNEEIFRMMGLFRYAPLVKAGA